MRAIYFIAGVSAMLLAHGASAQTTCFGKGSVLTCLDRAGGPSYQVSCFGKSSYKTCISQNGRQLAQPPRTSVTSSTGATALRPSSGASASLRPSADPAFGLRPSSPSDPAFGLQPPTRTGLAKDSLGAGVD